MIAEISQIDNSFTGSVYYNEKKINNTSIIRFQDNTFIENQNAKEYIKFFDEHISSNSNIQKNVGMHISLNLTQGEYLSDEQFKNLIYDYLYGMNWDNSPYLAYKHSDKEHSHIHIILSMVNWDGNKLNDSYYKLRSQKLSRKLEQKYNLKITSYDLSEKAKLNLKELNFRKYYIDKAIKKAFRDHAAKDFIKDYFKPEELKNIRYNSITNLEYEKILGNNYDHVLSFLHQRKYFNSMLKDELKNKLVNIYNQSSDINNFFDNLTSNDIYFRKVFIKGSPRFIYGLKDDNFYIDDRSLNKEFKYDYITNNNNLQLNKLQYHSDDDKMTFIRKNLYFSVRNSPTLSVLIFNLQQKGIETICYQNSNGIYGLSFKIMNDSDNSVFKASDISKNLSYNHIKENLQFNFEKSSITELKNNYNHVPNMDYSKPIPTYINNIPPTYSGPDRDELDIKRKKKKRRKRDNDNMNR